MCCDRPPTADHHPRAADHGHQERCSIARRGGQERRDVAGVRRHIRALSDIVADEDLASGHHRPQDQPGGRTAQQGPSTTTATNIKQVVLNGNKPREPRRQAARHDGIPDVPPHDAGQHLQLDRSENGTCGARADRQGAARTPRRSKEVCNMMGLRQFGCSTGTPAGPRARLRAHLRPGRHGGDAPAGPSGRTPALGGVAPARSARLERGRRAPLQPCSLRQSPATTAPGLHADSAVFTNALQPAFDRGRAGEARGAEARRSPNRMEASCTTTPPSPGWRDRWASAVAQGRHRPNSTVDPSGASSFCPRPAAGPPSPAPAAVEGIGDTSGWISTSSAATIEALLTGGHRR